MIKLKKYSKCVGEMGVGESKSLEGKQWMCLFSRKLEPARYVL